MNRKYKIKNIIAFSAVIVLLLTVTVTPAFAIGTPSSRQRFGAMIASALQAINIFTTATLAPAQNMLDAIADPPGLVGTYQYPWEPTWDDDYLNRTAIQIWPDYTTIDGVEYTDIWFSHDAAEKFRVNAFDWKTAYNVASESHGTFVSGLGYYDTIPIYQHGNDRESQMFTGSTGTYVLGTGTTTFGSNSTNYYNDLNFAGRETRAFNSPIASGDPSPYSWKVGLAAGNQGTYRVYNKNNQQLGLVQYLSNSYWNASPFDFDYVSGTIPADEVLPSDTGMMVRVPSDSQGLQTFIENHIEFTNEGGVNLDFDLHPELKLDVEDLLDILVPVVPVVNVGDIQFVVNHTDPVPVPDVPIVDATVPQVVNPIINEITNYGDTITESIPQIIETIPTINSICENIDSAPYHDLDTGLDHLPTFFLPFITDLRSALGIWHYVTEWISQISTTFAFVSGCLVGTSIMTPIYAAIAGFMCIKIYRRMTA